MIILRHPKTLLAVIKTVKLTGNIRFNHLVFVAVLFVTAACGGGGNQPAADILSKDEMVQILAEMYVVEEKVNRLVLSRDSANTVFHLMEGKVYQKTGIPDSVFAKSFNYYLDRPRQMELIYTALVDTLQLREQRAPFKLPGQGTGQ